MRLYALKHRVQTVTEILEGTSVAQCCHVPSERNPADMCSRGVASPEDLLKNQRDQQNPWYKGPKFLWNNTDTEENESKIIAELPDTNKKMGKCCFLHKVKETISMSFEQISKCMKLVHYHYVIAYISTFITNCKANKEKLKDVLKKKK